jgi:hypothetical protein
VVAKRLGDFLALQSPPHGCCSEILHDHGPLLGRVTSYPAGAWEKSFPFKTQILEEPAGVPRGSWPEGNSKETLACGGGILRKDTGRWQ